MQESNYLELRGYKVKLDTNEILINGDIIKLTPKQKDVLLFLYKNRGSTVSRSQILDNVWGISFGNDSGLTQAISKLRQIFKDNPKQSRFIKTVPKVGYQLVVDPRDSDPTSMKKLGIISRYNNLSNFQRLGIKLGVILFVILMLLVISDIQIRIQTMPA